MARSIDPKRAAARPKMPAKRSPARARTAPVKAVKAAWPERLEDQAPAPLEAAAVTGGNPVAAAPDAADEPAAAVQPEGAASAPPAEPAALVETEAMPTAGESVPFAPAMSFAPEPMTGAPAADGPAVSAPATDVAAVRAPVRAAAAVVGPQRSLVEGTIDLHGKMVAFAWRQTECSLAAGRALLASRSVPETLTLQSAFVGRSVENTLAHTLELTRLSSELLSAGLRSGRPR